MRTLVIDTATRACSVALYDGDTPVASHHEIIGRGHAERLLPLISKLPDCGKADRIVVDVGPGSFTGIRIGIAAARALGLAWNIDVNGYGCLALVAAMARRHAGADVAVDVIMAGGHNEYYFQSFDAGASPPGAAISLTPEALAERSHAPAVAGDFGAEIVTLFGHRPLIEILPDAACWHLIASSPSLAASPIYGRAPDAKLPQAGLT